MAKKRRRKKLTAKQPDERSSVNVGRAGKPFPTMPLSDALVIARTIESHAAGQPMRRLTLFDALGKSPESGPSRSLITASTKYGLTQGSYKAEEISLLPLGKRIVAEDSSPRDRIRAKFEAGIDAVEAFGRIHGKFSGHKLPSQSVLRDFITSEIGIPPELAQECIDTFIVNAKEVGVLAEIAGAERLLPIDHVLEELPAKATASDAAGALEPSRSAEIVEEATDRVTVDWNRTCFYVTPIGDPGTDLRKHSDLFLEHVVEPALAPLELDVVRADRVGQPGMITRRVIQYVVRSRLVVADLSHHNPNVFYELSLRHACGLPTIQIIRSRDRIPFDLKDFDTIQIDDTDVYAMIPKLEVYRSQIATQARSAIQKDAVIDNPIHTYFPGLIVTIPGNAPVPSGSSAGHRGADAE